MKILDEDELQPESTDMKRSGYLFRTCLCEKLGLRRFSALTVWRIMLRFMVDAVDLLEGRR